MTDFPSVTYCSNTSTSYPWNYWGVQDKVNWLEGYKNQAPLPLSSMAPLLAQMKKEDKIMARLIRYTVTDPDLILADKAPEHSILMSNTVMLNGSDDKSFLMEIAPAIHTKLTDHNVRREAVEYEDKEGKTKKLRPIKISQLDVVIEVLREYKA